MKTAMIQLLTFCFLTIPLSTSQAAPLKPIDIANAQDRTGGNVFEAEFKSIGRLLVQQMKQHNLTSEQLGFPIINFERAVKEVQVMGTDDDALVQVEGEGRQAINSASLYGITFKNSTWAILDIDQKRMLVAHEYCRVSGVDDSNWTYSARLLELVGSTAPQPGKTGRVFKILKVENYYYGTNRIYLENLSNPSEVWCSEGIDGNIYLGLSFRINGSLQKLHREYAQMDTCNNLLAFISTANVGMEVYLSLSPTSFDFN